MSRHSGVVDDEITRLPATDREWLKPIPADYLRATSAQPEIERGPLRLGAVTRDRGGRNVYHPGCGRARRQWRRGDYVVKGEASSADRNDVTHLQIDVVRHAL